MRALIIKFSPIEAITSSMFRTIALANGIVENGFDVDMLVLPMNKVQAEVDKVGLSEKINVIRISDNEVYRNIVKETRTKSVLSTLKILIKKFLRKCWHTFSIYDYTYLVAKNVSISLLPHKKYDLVISSSDPKSSHIAVKKLIKQGLEIEKWYQYWGDPLTIDITQTNIYPKCILKRLERKIIEDATKIVYVSPFTLEEQKKMFPDLALKMIFLPVPYMQKEIYPEIDNSIFRIGYYGNYTSWARDIIPFYKACCSLDDSYETSIYGDGNVPISSIANVKVHSRGVVDEHKKIADLLVCICNSSGTQIPGKLYHLAGTNKAVLVILDGDNVKDLKNYIDSFDRFITCDNNEESIRQAIVDARNSRKRYFPCECLRCDVIAKKFLE